MWSVLSGVHHGIVSSVLAKLSKTCAFACTGVLIAVLKSCRFQFVRSRGNCYSCDLTRPRHHLSEQISLAGPASRRLAHQGCSCAPPARMKTKSDSPKHGVALLHPSMGRICRRAFRWLMFCACQLFSMRGSNGEFTLGSCMCECRYGKVVQNDQFHRTK